MKKCTKCHKRLSLDNFTKDSNKKDGLYPSCKECYRKRVGSIKRPDWHGKIIKVNGVECRWCQGCQKYIDCDNFYARKNYRSDTRCKDCVLKMRTSEKYRLTDKKRRDKLR